jgi:hypothetical protein
MREAFSGDGYLPRRGFLNYAIDDHPLRIIGLDTLVPGDGGGMLCSDRLRRADHILWGARDRPTLVLLPSSGLSDRIVLDFRPEARLRFAFEPPGYQLHYWREGSGLVTHTAAIGDWPGSYFYSGKPAAS